MIGRSLYSSTNLKHRVGRKHQHKISLLLLDALLGRYGGIQEVADHGVPKSKIDAFSCEYVTLA